MKIKETDRIIALANELTKIGVNVSYTDDSLFISPSNKLDTSNKLINTYDDHRMALSFSTLAISKYQSASLVYVKSLNSSAAKEKLKLSR